VAAVGAEDRRLADPVVGLAFDAVDGGAAADGEAGLDALDEDDLLRRLIEKTLRAARDRSAEMAAEARRDG
jgi:hypothetical protein